MFNRATIGAAITLVVLSAAVAYGVQEYELLTRCEPWVIGGAYLLIIILVVILVYHLLAARLAITTIATNMAEDMIVYSRELFGELFKRSPVPYILIDEDMRVNSVNYAAVVLFRGKERDFASMKLADLFVDDGASTAALLPEYFANGVSRDKVAVTIHCIDGSEKQVLLSLAFFTDERRNRKGIIALIDTSARHT